MSKNVSKNMKISKNIKTIESISQLKQEIKDLYIYTRIGTETVWVRKDKVLEKIALFEQHLQEWREQCKKDGVTEHSPVFILIDELLESSKPDFTLPDPLGNILRNKTEEAKK